MHRTRVARVGALIAGLSLVARSMRERQQQLGPSTAASATTAAGARPRRQPPAEPPPPRLPASPVRRVPSRASRAPRRWSSCSDDFKAKLERRRPEAERTYNYAAETYDAVTSSPWRSRRPRPTASSTPSEINGITRDGTKCTDFTSLPGDHRRRRRSRLRRHVRPARVLRQRRAAAGQLRRADVRRQQPDRRRRRRRTRPPTAPASADVPQVPVEGTRAGDGVLKIGSILPQTGIARLPRTTRVRRLRPRHQGHQRRRRRARQAGRGHQG